MIPAFPKPSSTIEIAFPQSEWGARPYLQAVLQYFCHNVKIFILQKWQHKTPMVGFTLQKWQPNRFSRAIMQ